jgi:outer membrane immunogenic protein
MSSWIKIAAAALLASIPVAARATDMVAVPTSGTDSLPVATSGFDWNTFYGGIFGVGQASGLGGGQFGVGVDAGVTARLEFVLVGGEVRLAGLSGAGTTVYGEALGRGGIALSDDVILYGAGGLGTNFGTQTDALLGGGIEFAATDNVSFDARYLHAIPLSGANPKDQVTVGANFHF